MAITKRGAFIGLGLVGALALGAISLPAQEPEPTAARKPAPQRRVPPYFGQIGLTPEQRAKIYDIQAKHEARIAELKRQIEAVSAQQLAECEAVLTPTQRELLERLRSARRPAGQTSRGNVAAEAPKAEAPQNPD